MSAPDLCGKIIGRYKIMNLLGKGGMGEVYIAEDPILKRRVAVKRVAPHFGSDSEGRELLLKEAERASRLNNDRVAQVHDVIQEADELFVVMEYIEGATLRTRLGKPMALPEFESIATQCLEGLEAAHRAGIVHRDVKPENIMLTSEGNVKICDFGLAQIVRPVDGSTAPYSETTANLRGTPAYMAPEALLIQSVDSRTDIFSLGIVFYEALTAIHPFRVGDSSFATVDAILHKTPPAPHEVLPEIPQRLSAIVMKMLAKNSAERYRTAAEVLNDLRALDAGEKGRRMSGSFAMAIVIVLAIAVTIGLILYARKGDPPSPSASQGKTLVILPFAIRGAQSDTQAYTDGLIETVTARIGQLTVAHHFQIISANEVRSRRVTSAADARAEFGGQLVIEGTVERSSEFVRINYSLVDARTGRQLDSDSITVAAGSPFEIQDRVVEGVTRLLGVQLAPQERTLLTQRGTQAVGAYEFYLQGRGYLQNYDKPENLDNAAKVFEQALKADPNYALAHAGLGETFWKKYEATMDAHFVDLARQSCERALALDESVAATHSCLATVENGTGHYENAIAEFQHALEHDPTDDNTYIGLASAYEQSGRPDKAELTYKQAIGLRPQYWGGYSRLGGYYSSKGRHQEAEKMFVQVVSLNPDSYRGFSNLGGVYFLENKTAEAIDAFEKSLAIRVNYRAASNLATLHFYNGDYKRAETAFEQALKIQSSDYLVWGNLGVTREQLGESDAARQAYERAVVLGEQRLKVNPKDGKVMSDLATYHASMGKKTIARQLLARSLATRPDDPAVLLTAAAVYETDFGLHDEALKYVRLAVKHGSSLNDLNRSIGFKNLRLDPRFQEILRTLANK